MDVLQSAYLLRQAKKQMSGNSEVILKLFTDFRSEMIQFNKMAHVIRSNSKRNEEQDIHVEILEGLSTLVEELNDGQQDTLSHMKDLVEIACQVFDVDKS